jgi:hypothetical protein
MATLQKTLAKRLAVVKAVKAEFSKLFRVRKGWRYVLLACRGCNRMTQVPYNDPGRTWALRQLRHHTCTCRGY